MSEPSISIDLEKIEHNARIITGLCRRYGIRVSGVSKVACGDPDVARAMIRGGVSSIGESRLQNIQRLKANGVNTEFILLRTPPLSSPDTIVTSVDISLNSELSVIAALSESALKRGLIHKVIIMLDLGDLREGVLPEDLFTVTRDIIELPGVRVVGLGTNLSCYGGVVPSEENMGQLVYYAEEMEKRFNLRMEYISGGNSSSLELLTSGKMPSRINHLRLGESILLGRETINRNPVPETHQDAFLLEAEIIELKTKPSLPIGETAQDAFGNVPVFEDRGDMVRAILSIGREDIDADGIVPLDQRLSILGASSDHLLVDVTGAGVEVQLGDRLPFSVNYSALLAGMTSAYVEKTIAGSGQRVSWRRGVALLGAPTSDTTTSSAMIRDSLLGELNRSNINVQQHGNLSAEAVSMAIHENYVPIAISPDPVTSLEVYGGLPREKNSFGLIVFSAFGGFAGADEPEDGPGRSMLASALGRNARGGQIDQKAQLFKAENVVLIGVRSVSESEIEQIHDAMITVFTMEDIDSLGMKEVCYRAVVAASKGTAGIHVTCDVSVMDLRETAAITHPVVGGISYREAHLAMESLSLSGLLRSANFIGFTDQVQPGDVIGEVVAGFILSLCGKRILGQPRLFR